MLVMNYEDAINDYTLPLEEQFYNPDNYQTFLSDEHYHHQDKGCDTEIILHQSPRGDKRINKLCHTHLKECSKTGWELGWYMRTNSKMAWGAGKYVKKCIKCKAQYFTRAKTSKYCSKCRNKNKNKKSSQKY